MASRDGTLRYRRLLTRDFLVERMTAGRTAAQIAREVGCDIRAIYDALARHSLPGWGSRRGKPRPTWTDILTGEYLQAEYVEAGRDLVDIAGEVGCSHSTVRRALLRHGIELRPQRHAGVPIYEVPVNSHAPAPDLAAEVGASPSAVRRARYRAGVRRSHADQQVMTDDEYAAIAEAIDSGRSTLQAEAAKLGIEYRVLWSRLARWRRRRERASR